VPALGESDIVNAGTTSSGTATMAAADHRPERLWTNDTQSPTEATASNAMAAIDSGKSNNEPRLAATTAVANTDHPAASHATDPRRAAIMRKHDRPPGDAAPYRHGL
jgi:hypothetical protein